MEYNMQFESFAYYLQKRQCLLRLICLTCIFFLAESAYSAKDTAAAPVLRSRAYKSRHIPAKDAKQFLIDLKIDCEISELPHEVLIITSGNSAELTKASNVLELVDSTRTFAIKTIDSIPPGRPLPENKRITEKTGEIVIGTFAEPPGKTTLPTAIIDTHNQGLIIIAPVELIDGIIAAIQPPKPTAPGQTEPVAKPDEPETAVAPQEKAAETDDKPKEAPPAQKTEPAAKPAEQPQHLTETEPSPAVESLDTVAVLIEQAKPLTGTTEPNIPPIGKKVAIETKQDKEDFFLSELLETLAEAETKAKAAEEAAKPEQKAEETPKEPEPEQKPEEKAEAEKKADQPTKESPEQIQPDLAAVEKDAETKPEEKIPVAAKKDTVEQPQDEKLLDLLKALAAGNAAPQPKTEKPVESTEPAVKETPPKPDIPPRPKPVKPARVQPKATEEDTEPAQEPTPPQPPIPQQKSHSERLAEKIPNAEEVLDTVLILPEEVEMTALIELVGKQLKLNYMYDPRKLTGQKIVLKLHEGKIKVKDIYALLESVLKFKGFAMVRRDENLITIIPQAEAVKYDPTILTTAEDVRPGDVIVTTTFTLQHISTDTAVNLLKKMSLGLNTEPIVETNTLIVTGYAYRMDRIEQLLRMIDVPGKENTFQSRQLQYLLPSELAPKIKSLAAQLGTVQVTVSAPPKTTTPKIDPRTKRPVRTTTSRTSSRTTTPPSAAAKKGVYLDTDDRTNRILMIGTVEDIDIVNALIDTLDVPLFGLKTIKEYKIQYVEAADIVDALNELGVAKVTTSSKSRTSAPTSRSRTATPSRTTTTTTAAADQPQISIRQATNSLLVNATAEQHDAIATVIAHVDVEQTDARAIKEYEIKHVDTVEITDTLGELGIISQSRGTQRGTSSRTQSARTSPATSKPGTTTQRPTTLTAATGAEIASDEPQIATLGSTNSLLVNATPIQHAAIALIIAHVDRELDQITTPYVIYALENQDPAELSEVLIKLIQETVSQQGKTTSKDSRIQTKAVSTPRSNEERIKIIPDPKTYSLIVYANKKNQQWISALIEELDAYRPQVLIDVTLVNIKKNDDFIYDLDIVSKFPSLLPAGGTFTSTTLNPIQAFTGQTIIEATSKGLSGDSPAQGFYADKHIQALLSIIEKKGYGRVLARPKLLVNDNETGIITTTRVTTIVSPKTDVVPVQGGGGTSSTSISTQTYTSDITLEIEPHISKGDQLRLKINLNRTDFEDRDDYIISVPGQSGSLTGPTPPDLITSNVETVVTVPDNSTIILGGLETITQVKGGNKIPILGDIPLIGGLFRNINNTSQQNRLYVFVKARILRPGKEYSGESDIVKASRENRAVFEKYEKEMQEYEDWPGIEPEPMDPLRILEEDIDKEDKDDVS
jgi:type II secretory pathway component GspD/PulD (secretin)